MNAATRILQNEAAALIKYIASCERDYEENGYTKKVRPTPEDLEYIEHRKQDNLHLMANAMNDLRDIQAAIKALSSDSSVIKEYPDFLEYRSDREVMEKSGFDYFVISTCNSRGNYVVRYM